MAAPTAFSNPLPKWIGKQCAESLFFVMVEPKGKSAVESIRSIVQELDLLPDEEIDKTCKSSSNCTGFAVEERNSIIKILTSAHCIDHVFTASKPVPAEKVRSLFSVSIICDHYESGFRESKSRHKQRFYCPARVAEIDCVKDLLLLQIDRSNILGFNGRTCQSPHPPLLPSKCPPSQFESAAMVSWPEKRPRTSAIGEISHVCRSYDDASDTNPNGYGMTLVEVNIPGQKGSSGAPLIDGTGGYIALLHGGGLNRWGIQCPATTLEGQANG
ncbi:hypothetical protein EJB05_27907 [Eragrostis curvula]|uniref:Peptidase S1 domain-containing protein n=1 Tax=Eragrostis curvula TaxID=38414 RepID=A0A5J9UNT4_9POAL|nr:hypothetical protein EJB05_27907 [Eragrostis curvula]